MAICRKTSFDAFMGLERPYILTGSCSPFEFVLGHGIDILQLMGIFCLGFMGFASVTFYLSLYLQEVVHLNALEITLRLLPMIVSAVIVNILCGLLLHRVSNKVLVGIGALAFTTSFLILSFMKESATYWAFIFPALVLVVVGAEIHFNVTNVYISLSLPFKHGY